tara:strand:- start:12438 stop:14780 length:2343 start_codon:yes stop_codon:yes gene_type:complete
MAPVAEAKTGERAMMAGVPLDLAYEEVSALTNVRGSRRALTRNAYRETHTLLVNIPTLFRPTPGPIDTYLREQFPSTVVDSRVLLFGVKLQASVGSGTLSSAINSVAETFVSGGTPMSDYDRDFREVDEALRRAGLSEATAADIRLANGWWNHGTSPDTPALFHSDHLHIFSSAQATQVAESLGADQCATWPAIDGAHTLTFASVQDFDLPYVNAKETSAKWVVPLIQSGAAMVSVRSLVEPAKITREELRRQRKGYTDDLNARHKEGKMDRAELDTKLSELGAVEEIYSAGGGPTTLVDTSILVAFDGYVPDMTTVSNGQITLHSMLFRQQQAWAETMLCSMVRANPNLHDLPVPAVAYSGLPGLSTVGDREGALVGFTEGDRQPALLSPTAIAKEDTYPLCVVAAASGAGKSMMMLWLADQYARMGRPVVIIDPKTGSSHDEAVQASGGQVASLDSLLSADGVLDPLRFAITVEDGVEMAASMLLTVNPFGSEKLNYEVPLIAALNFGVAQGAKCIGQALQIAAEAGRAPHEMVKRVIDLANASPQFRAMVGFNPGTEGLRIRDGITLIKVGRSHLNLPTPGTAPEHLDISQRVSLSLVRMMLFGSATALTNRDGVIMQDEAWTILNADPKEVERLGRLARSQRVLPILFSQDISGAVRAGLQGFISRGFVGPIGDPVEARAALELFGIEATDERMSRITAAGTTDSYGMDDFAAPNWASMKALKDPRTREVLRGSVWLYSDLSGRVIPVECTIPADFLKKASTNAADIDARAAAALI